MSKSKAKKHTIKCGLIRCTISVRRTKGQLRYSLDIVRLYKDGECWKESQRFGHDDIPVMRLVLDKAYGWIWMQRKTQQPASTGNVQKDTAPA